MGNNKEQLQEEKPQYVKYRRSSAILKVAVQTMGEK